MVAPSCSLLHAPVDLAAEKQLDATVANWLAFATQKLGEIVMLAKGANRGREAIEDELDASDAVRRHRETSPRIHNPEVQRRLSSITADMKKRHSDYNERRKLQVERFKLPPLPTTTIGSFPQTQDIRKARARRLRYSEACCVFSTSSATSGWAFRAGSKTAYAKWTASNVHRKAT